MPGQPLSNLKSGKEGATQLYDIVDRSRSRHFWVVIDTSKGERHDLEESMNNQSTQKLDHIEDNPPVGIIKSG